MSLTSPSPPRKLESNEIDDLLSVIPDIKSPIGDVRVQNTQSFRITIRIQLKNIKIVPVREALERLKNQIRDSYVSSVIIPGTTVGVTAAEAMGGPITQTTLNTFHKAGTSTNISGGIKGFEEILKGSQNRSNPATTIVFKNRHISFDEIIERKRSDFIEVNVGSLILDYDIDTHSNFFPNGEPMWYSDFRKYIQPDIPSSNFILRLIINPNIMYRHRVLPRDICRVIEKQNAINVVCVYSPILIEDDPKGIEVVRNNRIERVKTKIPRIYIDIYPHDEKIKDLPTTPLLIKSLFHLRTKILPHFDKVYVKGIRKITDMFPVESRVWRIVNTEIREDTPDVWQLWYDLRQMNITGITSDNLARLCRAANMEVLDENQTLFLRVRLPKELPPDIKFDKEIKPSDLVNHYTSLDSKDAKQYEREQREKYDQLILTDPIAANKLELHRPPTEISEATNFVYADTNGSNLIETFLRDDVDPYHTYSNNMYEILNALGIEGARNFLILELTRMIDAGGNYINPRHITLISDFMTHNGIITKLTFYGIKKQPVGTLAQSSFEQALKVIKEAATFGTKDPISNVSGALFVGKRANIGTGYNQFFVDKKTEDRLNQMTDDNVPIDIESFKIGIETSVNASFGIPTLSSGNQEEMSLEEMFGPGPSAPPTPPALVPISAPLGTIISSPPPVPPPRTQIFPRPVIPPSLVEVAETVTTAICVPPEKRKTTDQITVQGMEPSTPTAELPTTGPKLEVKMGPIKVEYPSQNVGGTTPETLTPIIEEASRTDLQPIPQIAVPLPPPKSRFVDLSQYL